jgi:hypothetical protein
MNTAPEEQNQKTVNIENLDHNEMEIEEEVPLVDTYGPGEDASGRSVRSDSTGIVSTEKGVDDTHSEHSNDEE